MGANKRLLRNCSKSYIEKIVLGPKNLYVSQLRPFLTSMLTNLTLKAHRAKILIKESLVDQKFSNVSSFNWLEANLYNSVAVQFTNKVIPRPLQTLWWSNNGPQATGPQCYQSVNGIKFIQSDKSQIILSHLSQDEAHLLIAIIWLML